MKITVEWRNVTNLEVEIAQWHSYSLIFKDKKRAEEFIEREKEITGKSSKFRIVKTITTRKILKVI